MWLSRLVMVAIAITGSTPLPALADRPRTAPIPLATDAPRPPTEAIRSIDMGMGDRLVYRASWFETVLRDPDGLAAATISATSYVRDTNEPAASRPVLVLFNGGPGASSSPLHFAAFGPKRLGPREAGGAHSLIDNRETLLDVADLIFVDPVGTGFSRPLRDGGGARYWSVDGDAASVLTLIRGWLTTHGRTSSPLYLAGESYGAYRLGTMAKAMPDLNIAGLILISPALDFSDKPDQDAIDRLPTMAVAAWHHRRTAGDRRTPFQIWEDAQHFAQGEYAAALQQGTALDTATRSRVAAELAHRIALPVSDVIAGNLRIDSQHFLETLVPDHIVGRLDSRVVERARPAVDVDRPAAANDPSLGLGRSNAIVSTSIGDYLREEIGVHTNRDYYALTLDVNFSWSWNRTMSTPGESWSVVPAIGTLMRMRPDMRLLAIGGLYDLATPWLGTRYALTHGSLPMDRVTMVMLSAGHSPFEGEAARKQGATMMRAFLRREKILANAY